jgi:hypothetical protein
MIPACERGAASPDETGEAPRRPPETPAADGNGTAASADTPPRIRVGLWNIGGGGVMGADSHWGHVEDALRPGGPLHDLDVLICTEAKLRDGTTIASLGQRAAAARTGRRDATAYSILFVTAVSAAHTASYDEDDTGAGAVDRAMKHYGRRPWGGVLVLVINRRLRPTYVSGHKLGLLCVKLEWKFPSRRPRRPRTTADDVGAAAGGSPSPDTPGLPHPLILFALYNPAADSHL